MTNKDKYILTDRNNRKITLGAFGIWDKEYEAIMVLGKELEGEDGKAYEEFVGLVSSLKSADYDIEAPPKNRDHDLYIHRLHYWRGELTTKKYTAGEIINKKYFSKGKIFYLVAPDNITKLRNLGIKFTENTINAGEAYANLIKLEKLEKLLKQLSRAIIEKNKNQKTKFDLWFENIEQTVKEKTNHNHELYSWDYLSKAKNKIKEYINNNPCPALSYLDIVRDLENNKEIFKFNKKLACLLDFKNWREKCETIKSQISDTEQYAVAWVEPDGGTEIFYVSDKTRGIGRIAQAKFYPTVEAAQEVAKKYGLQKWAVIRVKILVEGIAKENNLESSILHSLLDNENIDKNLIKTSAPKKNKI